MIDTYRGLLTLIVDHNRQFEMDLMAHIRKNCVDLAISDMGFLEFWNFLLEIVMVLFAKFIFVSGIILITFLIILFFPFYSLSRGISFVVKEEKHINQPSKETKQSKN
jgi:hypothetical protein